MKIFNLVWILFFVILGNTVSAQNNIIKGKIIASDSGRPIAGVNILLQQTMDKNKVGEITDERGLFTMSISTIPFELVISHIGYETKKILFKSVPDSLLVFSLTSKTHFINEAVVTSKKEAKVLSDIKKYSVQDFEIIAQKILMLEFHGTFKSRRLSLLNLEGKRQDLVVLKKIKGIESLYKGCDDVVYLLTTDYAYPIIVEENKIKILDVLPLKTFDYFIKSCKIKDQQNLYYVIKEYNGLMNSIKKLEGSTSEMKTIRILLDELLIESYSLDPKRQSNYADRNAILNNDWVENRRLRGLQAESHFLYSTFYKPKYPIHIFMNQEELVLLNHPEHKIEMYKFDQLNREINIDYPLDKKWLKKIMQDEKTQQIYGVFDCKGGTEIKALDLESGAVEKVKKINAYSYHLKKIRVFDDKIFYLKGTRSELIMNDLK